MDGISKISTWRHFDDGYIVRSMSENDVETVHKWNCCGDDFIPKHDLSIALKCFPRGPGFYIGEFENNVVASAIRIPWGNGIYYGSMYYVIKRMRSRGFGTRLRDQVAFGHVGNNILCVDAVSGSVSEKNEEKFGYVKRFTTQKYEGFVKNESVAMDTSCTIIPGKEIDFEKLIAYDNKYFISRDFQSRKEYIRRFIEIPENFIHVALNSDGEIIGKGYLTPCIKNGYVKVGPLYADTYEIASDLLKSLLSQCPGYHYAMDIWQPNEMARKLVEEFHMTKVIELNRMHVNGDANELKQNVYAVTSLEVCGF